MLIAREVQVACHHGVEVNRVHPFQRCIFLISGTLVKLILHTILSGGDRARRAEYILR
jgi:hypothetical protein